MNRTKMIYFLSAIVCIIGCYAMNLSYSLFVQTEVKTVVDASVPSLSYSLENGEFSIPANTKKSIEINVINSGTADIKYGVSLKDIVNVETSEKITEGVVLQLIDAYDNNIVSELPSSQVSGENSSEKVLIYVTNSTEHEIKLTFNLIATYSTLSLDSDFITKSGIDCDNKVKILKYDIIYRAYSINKVDSQTNGYAMFSEKPLTNPAEIKSAEDEATLSIDEDDDGPSYYFRGNVKDNYLNFADMCWRIIRIAGDGSIRIILEDQDQLCDSKDVDGNLNMDGNWNIPASNGTSLTINPSTGLPYLTGNYGYDSVTYPKHYVANYLAPRSETNRSMINAFKYFQSQFTLEELEYLKSGGWCYDDKMYDTSYTLINREDYYNGSKTATLYSDTSTRIISLGIGAYSGLYYKPTFKCNGTILNYYSDNSTELYVGTLTADELVFAGAKYTSSNEKTYLINSYQLTNKLRFRTISLQSYMDNYMDYVFFIDEGAHVGTTGVYNYEQSFRPMITIKPEMQSIKGVGIKSEPYEIYNVN